MMIFHTCCLWLREFGVQSSRSDLEFELCIISTWELFYLVTYNDDTWQICWPLLKEDHFWFWGQNFKGKNQILNLSFAFFLHNNSITFWQYSDALYPQQVFCTHYKYPFSLLVFHNHLRCFVLRYSVLITNVLCPLQVTPEGEVQLRATDFAETLQEHIDLYITKNNSIPAFISAATIDLFQRQTMMTSSMMTSSMMTSWRI